MKTKNNKRISVKISEIIELKNRIKEINSLDLNDIDFISDDGSIVKIDKNIISDFRYTGLNNIEFIYTGFYKEGFEDFINK